MSCCERVFKRWAANSRHRHYHRHRWLAVAASQHTSHVVRHSMNIDGPHLVWPHPIHKRWAMWFHLIFHRRRISSMIFILLHRKRRRLAVWRIHKRVAYGRWYATSVRVAVQCWGARNQVIVIKHARAALEVARGIYIDPIDRELHEQWTFRSEVIRWIFVFLIQFTF